MSKKTNILDIGKDDVYVVLSPTKNNEGYSVQLSIPGHIEKKLESEDTIPNYVLVGFQICQYLANPEKMELVNQYFHEQMNKAHEEIDKGEQDVIID